MKIHIVYSHYNIENTDNKSRPSWFNYETCFKNLLDTIAGKNVEIHLAMDGIIKNNWISKYEKFYKSYEIEGGNLNKVTTGVYNVAKNIECEESDLIYILENDYLHVDNWVDSVLNLYQTYSGLTYISLYDHYDKYFLPMYEDLVSKIIISKYNHWRTTPSTCGSYITTKKVFLEDFEDHTGVTIPVGDHHKWIYLNQTKNRFIFTPMPGLSTHCMENLMSPIIDWENINKKYF